ncbi:MAG: sodium:solute symporter [Thermoanaerobaculia bacterium]
MNVGGADLLILAAYLAAVVALGLWIGRGLRTVSDFMVGDRNLPWWLILVSIVATETSTVTFLSIPGFAWSRDLTWLQIPLGFLLGRFAVAFFLLPQYFRGSIYTAYEVLHQRFGGATKQAASALFIVTRSLADGLRLFLTAIVLQEMTGIPMHWAVVALGSATILYCALGGMRAVLWTDLMQFVVYIGGALVAFWLLLDRLPGGWSQMVDMGEAAGKLRIFDLTLDWSEPYGLWAGLVGGIFITLGSHGVDQLMVQRYLCARGLPQARRALWVGGFVVLAQFALFLLIGVGLWCFYQLFPPEAAFDRPDRVFAHFILREMPVGVVGLLLGAIFAAAMSTLSSSLNSCATAAANDLYFPLLGERAGEERRKLRVTRWLTVFFGVVQIGVGIGGQWLKGTVVSSVLGIAAFTTGIVLGVFFLGLYAPRVGQRAALAGLLVGLASMTAIFFLTPLAWPWYALVGSLSTFAAGFVASYLWPRHQRSERW